MAATLDVWDIAPESAKRVGHPAPFPAELPERLIRLYTYEQDLVVDPFMGSGSALVAAARLGRRYVGYDLDPAYVTIARRGCKLQMALNNHRTRTSRRVTVRQACHCQTTRVPGPGVTANQGTARPSPSVCIEEAGFKIVEP